jgi:hypothetical protein
MFKLRSMMEDVAEKLFGRFLPEVEAKASHCDYILLGCCENGTKMSYQEVCWDAAHQNVISSTNYCDGICPA